MARFLRLTVEGMAEHVPVRHVRIFARRLPDETIKAPRFAGSPKLDGAFKEQGWPIAPQIRGFIQKEDKAFAAAPSVAWAAHHGGFLYLGVYLREPRMDTRALAAQEGEVDSIDAVVSSAGERVVVSLASSGIVLSAPEVAKAGFQNYATGWACEIGMPLPGSTSGPLEIELVRRRRNVHNEDSLWQGKAVLE
jgi:hypothetical protein